MIFEGHVRAADFNLADPTSEVCYCRLYLTFSKGKQYLVHSKHLTLETI